jgi:Abnormal spindle-like microcephaly-assoc'd, ASPM-SPD-2-Hydin
LNGYRWLRRLAISLVITGSLLLLNGCNGLAGGSNGTVGLGSGSLNFGSVPIGSSKTLSDTISNNTSAAITISSIQGLGSGFQVTGFTAPMTLAAGQTASFSVRFQPTATGDPTITISFDGPNAQPYASLSASATGVTLGKLSPSPSPVAFGNTAVGGHQTTTVTLLNSGGTDLIISSATMSGAGFSMSNLALPLTLNAGSSTSTTITFAPTGAGNFSGSVTFATTADQTNSTVVLNLSGTGLAPGTLSPNPTGLAFGSVQVGSNSSKSETLSNTGGATVTISQATPSGAGFSVSGLTLPVTLAANQNVTFTATFAPTSAGAASGTLSIVSNASNSPLSIPLSGTGLTAGALTANPTSVNFGNVTVGNNQTAPVTVTNTGGESVTLSSVVASGSGFSVTGATPPITLSAGQSDTFNVIFTPSAAGAASGTLTIKSNASNTTLSVPLSGTGVAQGQLGSNPASFSFGSIQIGTSKSLTGTLTNSGGSSLTISAATASGSGFSLNGLSLPLTLTAGQSTSFTVLFSPTASGAASGSVSITSNGSNPSLSIPLSGTGVTPGALGANPTSLVFGSVQVGNSANLSDTLTNTGGSSVTISQANLTGAVFSVSGLTLPLTLTPNQSVTFTATFTPTSAGAASGSLSVISNASNSTLNIALSGTGTAAGTLAVSPTSLSFGSVTVGSSSALNGSLTASGASVTVSSASLNNSEFALSGISLPATLPAGQSATFTVTFTPSASGATSASLSFSSNASNSPAVQTMTGTGAAATQHTVDLTWNTSSGAVGYNVYRGSVSGGPYTMINTSLDGTTAYTDSTVVSGQTYYYVATAVDGNSNESGYSNQATAVIPNP